MSEIHVRQIKKALEQRFDHLIDMSDYPTASNEDREAAFLSRAQAALVLSYLCSVPDEDATGGVTDAFGDNGIDAIHFDTTDRVLYLVQSKWKKSGSGSVDRGEMQKFLKGFDDLIQARWGSFNDKIRSRQVEIEDKLTDASTRISLVVAYTGTQPLSPVVRSDLEDKIAELNDPVDVVSDQILRQSDLYSIVSEGSQGAPIDLELALYDWGQIRDPPGVLRTSSRQRCGLLESPFSSSAVCTKLARISRADRSQSGDGRYATA